MILLRIIRPMISGRFSSICMIKIFTFPVQALRWIFRFATQFITSWSIACHANLHTQLSIYVFEPPHDKTNKVTVHPVKTQISLGICPVWSESSLSAWRKLGSLATHWMHSEVSDQTGWMPRLIWVFAGRTVILMVLSQSGSVYYTNACILLACSSDTSAVFIFLTFIEV